LFSRKFSISQNVNNLIAACSQSLFALQTLRQHGLPDDAIHEVFQAVVINKLTHASPAWWGFASANDKNHLEAFLRKFAKLAYRIKRSKTFASICDDADCKLFTCITGNTQHLLYPLLPNEREHHYTQSLCQRSHNFQLLPDRTSVLRDKNFIMRCCIAMLFTDNSIFFNSLHCVTAFCLLFY